MIILGIFQQVFQKILVSVKFLSAILGPETAAPILWTPGNMRPFCRKSHVHKIPCFRGGGYLGGGGGKCRFYFYGREDFSEFWQKKIISRVTDGCLLLNNATFQSDKAGGTRTEQELETGTLEPFFIGTRTSHCCYNCTDKHEALPSEEQSGPKTEPLPLPRRNHTQTGAA